MCRYGKTAVQAAKIPSLSTDAGSQRQSPVSQSLLVALCTFPCFYTSTLHTLTLKFTSCLTRQQLRQLLDMLQGRSANFSTALSKIQVHSYYVDDLHVALSLARLTTTAVHALYQDTIRTLRAPAQMHDASHSYARGRWDKLQDFGPFLLSHCCPTVGTLPPAVTKLMYKTKEASQTKKLMTCRQRQAGSLAGLDYRRFFNSKLAGEQTSWLFCLHTAQPSAGIN